MSNIVSRTLLGLRDKIYYNGRNRMLDNHLHQITTFRCGNDYGGFDVVEGPLKAKKCIVYSGGVGEDLSFSEDLNDKFDVEIYAFDPTPRASLYVKESKLGQRENFHFYSYGISGKDEVEVMYLPTNENYVSGSRHPHKGMKAEGIEVPFKRIKTIMNELGHDSIDVLKIDIEGSEFEVIDDILASRVAFSELLVEVHDRFFKDGLEKLQDMINSLEKNEYVMVSISNNRQELTFVKKEWI